MAEARQLVRRMCDAIQHRGPDSDGYFVTDEVALGMRRLSVIDVAGGDQPISNEDGTITVVYNGEIYNHHELRRELERAGHVFRTRSDTEVLVHAYEEYGPAMASRLHGMFAFAIWDAKAKRLFAARDRSGMKPLSYRSVSGGIVFCSELRSMWAYQSSDLAVAPRAVLRYLAFGYVPEPDTIFEGVRKVPPGHTLSWTAAGGPVLERFWSVPSPAPETIDADELTEVLSAKLDRAVASHLESEVPLGAFLSGGLDSSTVVALMSRHAAGRVRTFSIGFSEADYDESPAARAVATHFGTEHTEFIVRPDVASLFESVVGMFDEPFADSSAIPTFLVAQLARQSVTVALSGDGGDELFGGYSRYQEVLGHSRWPLAGAGKLVGALALMLPHAVPGRNKLVDLGRSRFGRYAATVLQPTRTDEGGVAAAQWPESRQRLADQLASALPGGYGDDFAAAIMAVDFETYLPGDILTKVDRTSMAVSLESRVPLLDCDLVDFVMRLPGRVRASAAGGKIAFRRAIAALVPGFVLERPKRGFQIPLGLWFRGPLREHVEDLRRLSPELGRFVDAGAVNRIVSEHLVGRRDHSATLWRLIVLDRWLRQMRAGALARPPSVPRATFA